MYEIKDIEYTTNSLNILILFIDKNDEAYKSNHALQSFYYCRMCCLIIYQHNGVPQGSTLGPLV